MGRKGEVDLIKQQLYQCARPSCPGPLPVLLLYPGRNTTAWRLADAGCPRPPLLPRERRGASKVKAEEIVEGALPCGPRLGIGPVAVRLHCFLCPTIYCTKVYHESNLPQFPL